MFSQIHLLVRNCAQGDCEDILYCYKIWACFPVWPSPVLLLHAELPEITRACMLCTATTRGSHACVRMGCCAVGVLALCRKHRAYYINAEHVLYLKCSGNVGFTVLKACSTCIRTSDLELWTEVCKCSQGPFWLQWCLVNLGLTCSPQWLKPNPSSIKYSTKFGSLVLLLAIKVAKWW